MRAFIGIEFPQYVKSRIIDIQNIIRSESTRGRWKYINNFHLTLKFLGEVSEKQAEGIYNEMSRRLCSCRGLNLFTGGIGFFKGQECLRVVFLNIQGGSSGLQDLFQVSEESSSIYGIDRERRAFTPHITVAQDVVLKSSFESIKLKVDSLGQIAIPVKEICIIKSLQIDNKRVYIPVKNIALSG